MAFIGNELNGPTTRMKDMIEASGHEISRHPGKSAAHDEMNVPAMPCAAFGVISRAADESLGHGKVPTGNIGEAAYRHCRAVFPENGVLTVVAEPQTDRDHISSFKSGGMRFGRGK